MTSKKTQSTWILPLTLASMSEGINAQEADRLQKQVPAHKLCEACLMGKQTREPSRQPRRQDPNKREKVKGAYISYRTYTRRYTIFE